LQDPLAICMDERVRMVYAAAANFGVDAVDFLSLAVEGGGFAMGPKRTQPVGVHRTAVKSATYGELNWSPLQITNTELPIAIGWKGTDYRARKNGNVAEVANGPDWCSAPRGDARRI
jgi:hypothetical protein